MRKIYWEDGTNIALLEESNCVSLCPQLCVKMHIIIKESLAGFTGPRAAEKQYNFYILQASQFSV
jgi:hypothetical protein